MLRYMFLFVSERHGRATMEKIIANSDYDLNKFISDGNFKRWLEANVSNFDSIITIKNLTYLQFTEIHQHCAACCTRCRRCHEASETDVGRQRKYRFDYKLYKRK